MDTPKGVPNVRSTYKKSLLHLSIHFNIAVGEGRVLKKESLLSYTRHVSFCPNKIRFANL